MTDDQLRDRLARTDPISGAVPQPVTSPEARLLLEEIMNTPLVTHEPTQSAINRGPRRWLMLAGAAAAIVAVAGIGAAIARDDDPQIANPTSAAPSSKVVELSTGTEDMLASCLALDPTSLAMAPVAFKGTVTSVEGSVVTLSVDEAYAGIDAGAVTLNAPEGMEALIGGVAWEADAQYLVTAYDGVVGYCGQTGPATPELQAIFDAAFPS